MLHLVKQMFPLFKHKDSTLLNELIYSILGPPASLVFLYFIIQGDAISERVFKAFLILHEIGKTLNHLSLCPILANHAYNTYVLVSY